MFKYFKKKKKQSNNNFFYLNLHCRNINLFIMKKNVQLLFFIISIIFANTIYAQDSLILNKNKATEIKGYYQSIDLNAETPCNCEIKTARNEELNTRLLEYDVLNYNMHAYKYEFGTSMMPASKLFHAFEKDSAVRKISFSMETKTFMLITTPEFDIASFEAAAKIAFKELSPIVATNYLYKKSINCYNAYVKYTQENALENNK